MGSSDEGMTYFQQWWKNNKAARNEARRKRYKEDVEYRKKCLEQTRDYDERRRKPPRDRCIVISKSGVRFYTRGAVAKAIGRAGPTVAEYQRTRVIPPATHWLASGWRLYSVKQYNLIIEAFRLYDSNSSWKIRDLSAWLYDRWR